MSHCVVPNWKQRHQRQEQLIEEEEEEGGGGEERNRSTHVHSQPQNHIQAVPMSNYEVAELTWENGQLSMHGLSGLLPTASTKPSTWGRTGDTLESIVHQATCHKQNPNVVPQHDHTPANMSSTGASSAGKCAETAARAPAALGSVKKRLRSDSDLCGRNVSSSIQEERPDRSACASESATIRKDKENDTTMMTWASFESPRSLKSAKTTDEDSACHDGSENLDEERETKGESGRSHSTRRCRAAAIHNQSERRRRDRINQKMKALQKLVPNASKTDKASMLDEVIEYLKQLQAQIQMMNTARNMPQMMMPLGMQQHLQMSLLARMGMGMGMGPVGLGMGMGMLDLSSMTRGAPQSPLLHPAATTTPTFVPPPFVVPQMIPNHPQPQATADAAAMNNSVPFNNPYGAFLAQSMNMELYNKMAAMYQQQVNQATQPTGSPLPASNVQGG